jgi:hypothetical protein
MIVSKCHSFQNPENSLTEGVLKSGKDIYSLPGAKSE